MQGSSSFLTVKQVATALGIDERSVRDKLTIGTLKGTKKTVGNKDQWFVHQRDLDAELARRGMIQGQQPQARPLGDPAGAFWTQPQVAPQVAQQAADSNTSFQGHPTAVASPQPPPPEAASAPENVTPVDFDDDVTEIFAEVQEPPEAEKNTSGGERLNWLNEDMQKQLQMTAEVFMKPLVARIEALTAADKEKDALIRAKDQELEEAREQLRLLPDFEAQRAKLLNEIEAERQAAEIQFAKAKEREEEAKALTEENEHLKRKAEEALLSAAKLEELEKRVLELQKPKPGFWQKFFGAPQ
jgi:hypothetical protein